MQRQVSLPKKVFISAIVMAILILFVYFLNIPNPNMILIAGLVLCSAVYGYGGGITAAIIMFFYTLFFFSTDHSFTQFTTQNLQKVIVSLVGIVADMLLVCSLKRAEEDAFCEVDELTKQLHRENEHLLNISVTDALTGCRNRMALRQDYDNYQKHEVTVMMIDLDNFKSINDTLGHEEGDRILVEIARLLTNAFGKEHCYRYGGDEFLIISPDLTEAEFEEKMRSMENNLPVVEINGKSYEVGFSAGYVHAMLRDPYQLRELFADADTRMYNAKREKRNFDRKTIEN